MTEGDLVFWQPKPKNMPVLIGTVRGFRVDGTVAVEVRRPGGRQVRSMDIGWLREVGAR